jgi:hypothetical protein
MTDLADLITIIRHEIAALRKNIGKHESDLQELQKQLDLHEKIAAMLPGTRARKTTQQLPRQLPPKKPARAAKKSRVRLKGTVRTNWMAGLHPSP